MGVFGKSWLKAMSSKKPHLCIPNQRIHKCGFCAKSTLINSENSHSGGRGSPRVSAHTLGPFGTFGKVHFNKQYSYKLSTMYIKLLISEKSLRYSPLNHNLLLLNSLCLPLTLQVEYHSKHCSQYP